MSQEEDRAEPRRCREEIFRCSEHLVAAKEILATTHTIWIATRQNPCFLRLSLQRRNMGLTHQSAQKP